MDLKLTLTLKPSCSKCGGGGRNLGVNYFKRDMFAMTESSVRIFSKKSAGRNCCWWCKKKPTVGEKWGMSVGYKDRNRIFCPDCSEKIEGMVKEIRNGKI